MKVTSLLLLLALAAFAADADADGKRERERPAPATRCTVHDSPLIKVTGFTVERGKPTMDYIRFSSETRRQFPHTTPLGFSSIRDDMHPREITFTKCERCGRQNVSESSAACNSSSVR